MKDIKARPFSEFEQITWETSYSDAESHHAISIKVPGHMANLIRDLNKAVQDHVMEDKK
jgi:hypothetical protein